MAGKLQINSLGFRKRVAWRGPFGVLGELISNALDEDITACEVTFAHLDHTLYRIRVEDDSPDGFRNLDESYTLYADSYKVSNPLQRGRFNFGEKVAIVLCEEASIASTTGTIVFTPDESKRFPRRKRDKGTVFEGTIRCTRQTYEETCAKVRSIIVPEGINVTLNGEPIPKRIQLGSFMATLPTIAADDAGNLIKTERKTEVNVYEPLAGEEAMIFELGIPVVKTGDVFHVDVRQKVPLSVDRNNVTPKFLKRLRAATLDATYDQLTPEQSSNKGVTDGLSAASPVAIAAVLDMRFGQRRFVPDFNREATGALTAEGFTAVPPNAFDKQTFAAIKKANALRSGNQLRPKLTVAGKSFAEDRVTDAMTKFRAMTEMITKLVLDKEIIWKWSDTHEATTLAQCGPAGDKAISLTINVARLGVEWFSESPASNRENLDLIFHELGHYNGAMDCTREHCDGVTFIASSVAVLIMTRPQLFAPYV